jgi:hypothetical protein
MRAFLAGFVLLLVMGFVPTRERGVLIHRFVVQPSSKITIDGKTNINSFQCAITRYFGRDTLVLQEGGRNKRPIFTKGHVGLEAASFDCGMPVMTKDFGKTIKSSEYPFIFIEFISFERGAGSQLSGGKFKGKLKISIGGVTKAFDVDCTIEAKDSGLIHLQGGRDFTFSDFDLEPPSKMMGMVKVSDALKVKFHLVLLLDHNA